MEKEVLLEADQVEAGYGSRYIAVPEADSNEGYRDMEDFIATVRDERLQDRLWQAIAGRGAFGRFKDVLSSHFHERERWFEFQETRLLQRVLEWLKEEGIEPIIEGPPPDEKAAPEVPPAPGSLPRCWPLCTRRRECPACCASPSSVR